MNTHLSHFVFIVICLLSLLSSVHGQSIPNAAFGAINFTIDVGEYPAIAGNYPAVPSLFGTQPHPGDLVRRVLLSYPDPTSCGPNGNDGMDQYDVNGNSFNDSIVLIVRGGGCDFVGKVQNAIARGVAAVVIYNFQFGADTTTLMYGTVPFNVSCIFIPYSAGSVIAAAASDTKNYTIMGRIPGTGGNMHPDDRATLIAIDADKAVGTIYWDDYAGLNRGWTDLALTPQFDGCGNRLYGVWCKNGRVQVVTLDTVTWAGGVSPLFNNLTALTFLQLTNDFFTGPLPCLNRLTNLQYLIANDNTMSGLPSASCLNTLVNLEHAWFSDNSIQQFPTGVYWPSLKYFLIANNNLNAKFGVDISLPFSTSTIQYVDYSFNPGLSGPMPAPSGWPSLQVFTFTNTAVTNDSSLTLAQMASMFDNLPNLQSVNLKATNYRGPLPKFYQCTNLVEMEISQGGFYGAVPSEWATLTNLQFLTASGNQIESPIDPIRNLNNLAAIDFSHNLVTTKATGFVTDAWSVFVFRSIPISTQVLDLSYNSITGYWLDGFTQIAVNLRSLNMAHNQLTGQLIFELWTFPNTRFEAFDFSSNQLTGSIPDGSPYSTLQVLYLDNNTLTGSSLPSWVAPTDEFVFTGQQAYVCPTLTGTSQKLAMSLDPTYYNYQYCVCEKGRYGIPPNCDNIPVFVDASGLSFGDSDYGDSNRRTIGIDTSWVFNGTELAASELHGNRLRTIYFHLNYTSDFTDETDAIDIHEGGADLKGDTVWAIRGNDAVKPSIAFIFTPTATLNFRSRKEDGVYFSASLSFSDQCPPGYSVSTETDQCEAGGISDGDSLQLQWQGNLIVLAYVLSVVGGWTTFIINENVLFARSKALNPIGWLLATGLTLGGASIWSWNGIAMPSLSFDKDVPITFDATISMACIVLPMGLTFIGLSIASLDPFLYPASKNGQKAASVVSSMTRESQKGSRAERAGSKDGDAPQPERQVSVEHQDVEEEAHAKFAKAQARKAGGPIKQKLILAIRQLNRYVFIGALFIGAAVVTTHWVWLTSFRMSANRTYNYGNDLAAILVVYGISVPVTFIAFFFRGVLWNFVAAFLFAAAQICCFFIDISGHTYTYSLDVNDNSVTLDKNVVILIACAVSAVSCFGFIGFNVIKLKVSRGALQYLLKKFKKEIQRMENEIQRERHVNQKMLEKLQAQQHALDLITYCTPTLSEYSVAACLAGKVEARVSSGAQLKYSQGTGPLAPFLEPVRSKLGGTNDHLDPKLFSQITVPVLLSHPVTIELFKDEFVKHNAPETIMFWLNVQLYKKIKENTELQAFGREIIDKYISEKGEFQINISGSARNKLLDVAHSGHFDHKTFQSVETETVNLMSNQYLMQFRATPAFRLCAYILEEVALQEKAAKAAASVHHQQHRGGDDDEKNEGSVTGSIAHSERERAVSTNQNTTVTGGAKPDNGHVNIDMNTTNTTSAHEDVSRTDQ